MADHFRIISGSCRNELREAVIWSVERSRQYVDKPSRLRYQHSHQVTGSVTFIALSLFLASCEMGFSINVKLAHETAAIVTVISAKVVHVARPATC